MRLLIDGATVRDGSGAAAFLRKVLIENERIVAVARKPRRSHPTVPSASTDSACLPPAANSPSRAPWVTTAGSTFTKIVSASLSMCRMKCGAQARGPAGAKALTRSNSISLATSGRSLPIRRLSLEAA